MKIYLIRLFLLLNKLKNFQLVQLNNYKALHCIVNIKKFIKENAFIKKANQQHIFIFLKKVKLKSIFIKYLYFTKR